MKFLRDTSGLSRAQRVGASFHLFGSGICTSTPAVGASGMRFREMCVSSGMECAWHGARRSCDAGDLDCGFSPPRLVPRSGCLLRSRVCEWTLRVGRLPCLSVRSPKVTLVPDCPHVRREAFVCGEREADPPSLTVHSLSSLEPSSPTQRSS
jgi:hypothetical protein